MAVQLAYHYAEIDMDTNMCVGVHNCSYEVNLENWIEIPGDDPEYCFKYYNWNNGKFYYDVAYTQEYISPLM